jgi:BlaI family transcriptional regulator, penicillinase repressor
MKKEERLLPKPTEGELELLRVLWEKESATVRELYEAINQARPVVYTSVLKLLQIMTEKGLVRRDEGAKAHIYRANVTQEATQERFLKDLSERLFAGSAARLALHALAMEPAGEKEIQEIRKLLESRKGKR